MFCACTAGVQRMARDILSHMRSSLGCTVLPSQLPVVWGTEAQAEAALADALKTHCTSAPALLVVVLPATGAPSRCSRQYRMAPQLK